MGVDMDDVIRHGRLPVSQPVGMDAKSIERLVHEPYPYITVKADGQRGLAVRLGESFSALVFCDMYGESMTLPQLPPWSIMDVEVVGQTVEVFDLLALDGTSMINVPFCERYGRLQELMPLRDDGPIGMRLKPWFPLDIFRPPPTLLSNPKLEGWILCLGSQGLHVGRDTSVIKLKFHESIDLVMHAGQQCYVDWVRHEVEGGCRVPMYHPITSAVFHDGTVFEFTDPLAVDEGIVTEWTITLDEGDAEAMVLKLAHKRPRMDKVHPNGLRTINGIVERLRLNMTVRQLQQMRRDAMSQ